MSMEWNFIFFLGNAVILALNIICLKSMERLSKTMLTLVMEIRRSTRLL